MLEELRTRYGGSWDGDAPEIHGLMEIGGKKWKVELLFVKVTQTWQCSIFEGGECVAIEMGESPVEAVARGVGAAL